MNSTENFADCQNLILLISTATKPLSLINLADVRSQVHTSIYPVHFTTVLCPLQQLTQNTIRLAFTHSTRTPTNPNSIRK